MTDLQEVEVRIRGEFEITEHLVDSISDAVRADPLFIDPVVFRDRQQGTLNVSAEFLGDEPNAWDRLSAAVEAAMLSSGAATQVHVARSGEAILSS